VHDDVFDEFYSEGYITDVIRPVKSGKEAAVYLCRANESITGRSLLAAKVYRDPGRRDFRNDAVYKDGRVITKGRERRAMQKKTRFGREIDHGWWHGREWEALETLHGAGAAVPRPFARAGAGILMDYVGDEEAAAPQLRQVSLDREEAQELFDRLIGEVELWLTRNVVHADLSAFNVLYWEGEVTTIDFPQFVDPRTNRNAYDLLTRDVENLGGYFERFGVRTNARNVAADLWTRFIFAEL